MKFKGILLDLDNTLYSYDRCHKISIDKALGYIKLRTGHSKETIHSAFKQSRSEIQHQLSNTASSHNRLLYFQATLEKLHTFNSELALETYNQYWDTFLQVMHLREDAKLFLEKFSHTPICLVTDLTAHIQYRKIHTLGISQYISAIVTSEEAGADKPAKAMFHMALQKLNLKPDEAIMIGDSYSKDIEGAVNCGIKSFWLCEKNDSFKDTPMIQPIHTFHDLVECLK